MVNRIAVLSNERKRIKRVSPVGIKIGDYVVVVFTDVNSRRFLIGGMPLREVREPDVSLTWLRRGFDVASTEHHREVEHIYVVLAAATYTSVAPVTRGAGN